MSDQPENPATKRTRNIGRRILAIDASTEIASACFTDGVRWIERREDAGQRHSAIIMDLIRETLDEAQCAPSALDEVAFGAGPGSFTGLRIACGIAQGIAFGADVPVRAVSSLMAIAQASQCNAVLAAIDARMNEVYWAAYRRAGRADDAARWIEVVAPTASPASRVQLPAGDAWSGAGNAFGRFPALVALLPATARIDASVEVTARAIAELAFPGEGILDTAAHAMPLYIRDKVARTSAERASAERAAR